MPAPFLGVTHHGVVDRPVVGHARNATGILSELVHVGASRIRLGGIGDRRPRHRSRLRHRTVGVVAHGCGIALGALGHGSYHARIDRVRTEHSVDVRIAAHTLERKAKGVLGERKVPGVIGQDLLGMDDDLRFVCIVAIGEGCDLIGNIRIVSTRASLHSCTTFTLLTTRAPACLSSTTTVAV